MPTGYTHFIEDGKITTGKDFLKLCTRAFGIAIDLKDNPLTVPTPNKFKPSDYHKKEYEESLRKLQKAKEMTFQEAKEALLLRNQEKKDHYQRSIKEYDELIKKYNKVKREVEEWTPPTESHEGVKKFALDQINMCVDDIKKLYKYIDKPDDPFDDSESFVRQYIIANINFYQRKVDNHRKSWEEELKRTEEKNEWMKKFLDSLDKCYK